MASTLTEKYRGMDPRMIYDLASGIDDPLAIAKRYGFSESEWAIVSQRKELNRAVEKQRAEMARNGTTFRNKAGMLMDSMLTDLYTSAMRSDIPVKEKAAAILAVGKFAGFDTPAQTQPTGPAFSITINLPSNPPNQRKADVVVVETPKALEADIVKEDD